MTHRSTAHMRLVIGVGAALALVVLAGCQRDAEPAPTPDANGEVETLEGVVYRTVDGVELQAGVCLPTGDDDSDDSSSAALPAMVLLHGGGFEEGSRWTGGMRELCEQVAESGIAAFSIDYRLVPDYHFPTQLDDARTAIEWLRAADQVERFGIDPGRIGVIGSSAGAIIAQSVGTFGEGPDAEGSRVRLVVSLSGASNFTPSALDGVEPDPEAQAIALAYLGCDDVGSCPNAVEGSPQSHVDSTDPPMLLITSEEEFVPVEQAIGMRDALTAAGIDVELVVEKGSRHGMQLSDAANTERILAFIGSRL